MSLFKTKLPVAVEELVSSLPKGASVNGIGFDKVKNEIIFLWECDKFHSGLSVPIDFIADDLKKRKLPEGVRDLSKKVKKSEEPATAVAQMIPPKEPMPPPTYLTLDQFTDAVTAGKSVEYQGVLPTWSAIEPGHVFTVGYFYRLTS